MYIRIYFTIITLSENIYTMTVVKELQQIISLLDENHLTTQGAVKMLKEIVKNIEDENATGAPLPPPPLPTKNWMSNNIDKIKRSLNLKTIINLLKDPEYCLQEFKCDRGMAVCVIETEEPLKYVTSSLTEYERYFRIPFIIGKGRFWVYSNWPNASRDLFDQWIKDTLEISEEKGDIIIDPLPTLLTIELQPRDEKEFKRQLLTNKRATIKTYFKDGKTETKIWNAYAFTESSNVLGNLRSRPQFRTGEWQERGIIKVIVSIDH